MCIFESDSVKSDIPLHIFRKIMEYLKIYYRLLVYLTCLLFVLEILKKWSENWSFSEFFLSLPRPKSEKIP